MRIRAKLFVSIIVAAGVAVLAVATAVASKRWIAEEWYILKLGSSLREERVAALKKLNESVPLRALLPIIRAAAEKESTVDEANFSVLGPDDIKIKSFEPKSDEYSHAAVRITWYAGKKAVPYLVKGLGDENWKVRFLSAYLLGKLRGEELMGAREALTRVTQDKEEGVRELAWLALKKAEEDGAEQHEGTLR